MIDRRHHISTWRCHPAWALMALMVLSIPATQTAFARGQSPRADSEPICRGTFGKTCGAYSMYAALRLLNKDDVSLDALISPSYITTAQGSTAGDLIGMAEHYGVPAAGFTRWRLNQLREAESPAILEVRPNLLTREYSHWVMVYPAGDDAFLIVDPPFEPSVVSGREIASRWRGRGILLGQGSQTTTMATFRSMLSGPIVLLLLVVPVIFGITKLRAQLLSSNREDDGKLAACRANRLAMQQGGILVVLTCVVGYAYQMTDEFGLLRNRDAAIGIQLANAAVFMERVGYPGVNDESLQGAIIIDARKRSDYALGHLPGAINIPVDLSDEERRSTVNPWPKDARILIYCQSSACDYDERIATFLYTEGYTNIALYEGGWVDWQSHQIQQASAD